MKRTKIDEKLFKLIRMLYSAGSTADEICDYYGVSPSTVYRIGKYDTYEEYRQQEAAIALAYKKRKGVAKTEAELQKNAEAELHPDKPEVKPQEVQKVGWYTENRMIELLKKHNELLEGISNKLAYIVEQLT